ncbi:hypothetical protein [Lewinella cohaerens]|uniref:hypothetical protein n=1 Tax=Lewinella cohaerens TaxID=70995 RepID=UPI00146EEA1A|nr:hypothetical protein [Lewinella cohaerens]
MPSFFLMACFWAMPVMALRCKHHYGTRLSVAAAPAHPLSSVPPGPELRPIGLRTFTDADLLYVRVKSGSGTIIITVFINPK